MKIAPFLLAAALISAPAAAADRRTACPGCRAEHEALVSVGIGENTCRQFNKKQIPRNCCIVDPQHFRGLSL